jgi:hypothetical protein
MQVSVSFGLDVFTANAQPARKLCFVLWDHQLAMYNYQPRNLKQPVPETCPLLSGGKNPVTTAWEAYLRGILHLCNPNMSAAEFETAWNGLWKDGVAFTDHSDPASGNFALHSLTCGGATHEMVTGESVIKAGHEYVEIFTLNSRKFPPSIPARASDIDMTRHFFATSGSNVQLPDGSYRVNGFPHFENCIIPLVSPADTDFILVERVKVVAWMQRPYNP